MHELVINTHMHTTYSDGFGTHVEVAKAALQTSLDAVLITDHNVWVDGIEGYFQEADRRVLILVGEEIHDPARDPQKNHLLVFGAGRELAPYAVVTQRLIEQVNQSGGLSFIAHPNDPPLPAFNETDISWVDWQVKGFTGIEVWNAFSEFKGLIRNKAEAVFYAYFPQYIARGPLPETLRQWDQLTGAGRKVVAIGGSDAHAIPMRLGPLRRTVFPYSFHFQGVNTHLLVPQALSGNLPADRALILDALRAGHAFIGYDLPKSTRGFRFSARGREAVAIMGDTISVRGGLTLQIRLPHPAECYLLKDGKTLRSWKQRDNLTFTATEPGVYRVEAYLQVFGRRRGWIFSNPIYVRE